MKPYIFPSSIETARALILHLVKLMLDEPDRTFCIAFSGGSTPALMFDLWANEYTDITPWERLKVFWVDERCVPPENSDSNYGMMRSLLLSIVPIPYENVFRIQGEKNPKKEAARYSKLVMKEVPVENEFPVFDVVLLEQVMTDIRRLSFPDRRNCSQRIIYMRRILIRITVKRE